MATEAKTVAETPAEAPAQPPVPVAPVVEAKPAVQVKPAEAKPVKAKAKPARRSKTPAAKVVAAVKKVKARRVSKARRPRAAKPAAAKFERIPTMTFDANNLFANLGTLPGADKVQELFADAGERSQELVRRSQKAAEELAEIAKGNVEALTEASRIAATGARAIGQDVLASNREGIEQASAAVRSLADAKSPTEFFQLQAELARASFDRAVAEGSKLTEQLVKLAGEAVQPLSTRASINAERINELAA